MHHISDSEELLMKILWQHGGSAMFAEISSALEQQGQHWKKNTILTFLVRLIEKGYLQTQKIGRRNQYIALVAEQDYKAALTRGFIGKVYEGDVSGLISTLVDQQFITQDELDTVKRLWEEKFSHHD